MKTKKLIITILYITICIAAKAQNFDEWFRQKKTQRKYLAEQIAKLQVYLGYLKQGYDIAQDGLTLVSDIKNGDFNLHRFFFDRLARVNPLVKRYAKVADIISMQVSMLKSYKDYYSQFSQSHRFSDSEIEYLYHTLTHLLEAVATDVEDLTTVVSDGLAKMQDDERIKRVNTIHDNVTGKYKSFFTFTHQVTVLQKQREKELDDLTTLKKLYEP